MTHRYTKKVDNMGALREEDLPCYTYNDYLSWEGNWELIHGLAYAVAPAPMIKHQLISNNIAWELNTILQDCKMCQALLPVDWKISNDTIVQPDNSVICHKPTNEAYITKAPKIIFEILSVSTAKKDKGLKYNLYEQEGVSYYCIMDPKGSNAKVYKLQDKKYIKIYDTKDDVVEFKFDEREGSLEFDFSKIWG